jgi:hypothetical protein
MEHPIHVLALTLAALWPGYFQAGEPAQPFSSAVCHVAFTPPAGWDVEKIESASGHEREGTAWFALGRLGARMPAQPIKNGGWTGARGTKIIECFRKSGGSAGPCEVPAAFIGTGQRSAELEGGPASGLAFDSVLQSLRFLP